MSAGVFQFGDFELDGERFELFRAGRSVKVERMAMELLLLLVSKNGQLVTREQIAALLWPPEVFVDTEHGINSIIRKIRVALRDDSDQPRFVQTVTGKGYRFIAPIARRGETYNGKAAAGAPYDDPALPQYSETVPRQGYQFIAPVIVTPATGELVPSTVLPTTSPSGPKPFVRAQSTSAKSLIRVLVAATFAIGLVTIVRLTATWQRPGGKPAPPETPHLVRSGWQPALSQDGKMVAYLSNKGSGPLHIWVSQTSGSGAMEVTSGPYADYQPDFSPDGTRIVFVSERSGRGLFITPVFPGEAKLLVASSEPQFPTFSPNGDQILYEQHQKAFLVSPNGGPPTPLALNQSFLLYGPAHWSPDGTAILFYGAHTGDKATLPAWWIVPLGKGQPRSAHLQGAELNNSPELAVRAWIRIAGDRDWIIYSTSDSDSWKLWRIGVSSQDITGQPQLLAEGNGHLGPLGSASKDGSVAYVVASEHQAIFQIHLDHRGERFGPIEDLLSNYAGKDSSPSVSRDGRWMTYDSAAPGEPDSIRLRDLANGTDHLLDNEGRQATGYYATSISPDGSRAIFTRDCLQDKLATGSPDPLPCGFLADAAGGKPEQICVNCTPRGFSSDGFFVLLQRDEGSDGGQATIDVIDLKTRKQRPFFQFPIPHESLYHAFLSWDDRWVVFEAFQRINLSRSQLLIAPVRDGLGANASTWIPITDGQQSDDKPQFSADGNTVFYTSTRDGYLCIWAQRLSPQTKHPVGPAFAFEHFHNAAGRGWIYTQHLADLSVARDKLLISLTQADVGIWMTKAK